LDEYSRHEVLDRLSLALDGLQSHILDHEVVVSMDADDPVKVSVVDAMDALVRAYNAMGDAHLGE
jgi:hypothetical protein